MTSVTETRIKRLEELIAANGFSVPTTALAELRDVRRLRNLYPAHPDNADGLNAADGLGLTPWSNLDPSETWRRVLRITRSSLITISEAISRS